MATGTSDETDLSKAQAVNETTSAHNNISLTRPENRRDGQSQRGNSDRVIGDSSANSIGSPQRTIPAQGEVGASSSNLTLASIDKGKSKSDDYRIRFDILEPTDQRNLDVLVNGLDQIEHLGIFCDGPRCSKNDVCIKGTRYKCALCNNVDFCSVCIRDFANQHNGRHKMIRCKVPTICKVIKEFDDESRKALISNDPTAHETDLLHAVVTETVRSAVEPSIQQHFSADSPLTVFALVKDTDPESEEAKRRPNMIELDPRPEQGQYVTGYRIDEAFNVTKTHQPFNADRRVSRESGVQHDFDNIIAVTCGRMKLYDYTARREFYESVGAGHLVTRVLDLLPGKEEDKLEVDFRIVDLAEAPSYEALSYTWKETAFARAHNNIWDKETSNTFSNMMEIQHPVYCGQAFFKIGVGLRDALRSLRHESKTQTYWVDQISINQDDVNERAFQVRNMASIYNRAKRTVVWVGDEDKDSVTGVRLIQTLSVARQRFPALMNCPEKLQAESDLNFPPVDSQQWLSLFRFFSRPIYERIWVIQEIVVAQDIVVRCGPAHLSWNDIYQTALLFCSPPWAWLLHQLGVGKDEFVSNKTRLAHIIHVMGFRTDFHNLEELSMERLLYSTSKFEASDSRDKVYACLGLRTAKNRPLEEGDLRPKYDISIQECFIEAAKYILTMERSFAICGINTTVSSKALPGLPSWVPDLSLTNHTCQFAFSRLDPASPYKAAGDSEFLAVFPYDSHPNLLITSTAKVGTITHISNRTFSNTDQESEGLTLGEWAHLCATQCGQNYRSGQFCPDAFWRTLVADSTTTWRRSPAPDSYHIPLARYISNKVIGYLTNKYDEEAMGQMMATSSGEVGEMLNPVIASLGRDYLERDEVARGIGTGNLEESGAELGIGAQIQGEAIGALNVMCHDRKFFITDSLFMGIGPSDAEVGDEVHILAGGKVPFIFRNVKNETWREAKLGKDKGGKGMSLPEDLEEDMQVYRLLGETYVHGLMKGEALQLEGFGWNGIGVV